MKQNKVDNPHANMYGNIPIRVTVLLGQTQYDLKTIKEMGEGSILELTQKPNEDLIVLFNGKSKWKGEVLLLDDKFGIRLTTPIPEDEQKTYLDMENYIPMAEIKIKKDEEKAD